VSRPLVTLALVALALAGLAPVALMALRVSPADLAGLGQPRMLGLLGRTLALGLATAGLATFVGAPFGWLVARTDLPGRALLRPLAVVPLCLPPLLLAMATSVLLPVRGGPAIALTLGASSFPLVALFVARQAERADGRLVEAARLVGGTRAALAAELVPLAPAALAGAALAFALAVNDFAVPDYLSAVGVKFNVYADEVFARWQSDQGAGRAVAAALPLLALTALVLLPALAALRRGSADAEGGARAAPELLPLGAARWPLFALALGLVAATALAPLARMVWEAGGGPRGFAPAKLGEAFSRALELARANLGASLWISAAVATLAVPLALVLGHAARRARGGRLIELAALVPFAVPGVLLGIGTIVLWNRPATAALYDGPGMAVVLLLGRFAVLGVLAVSGSAALSDPRLEEAARLAGARPATVLARIVAPGLRPALLGAWTAVFVFSMRELDSAILVPAANRTIAFRIYNAVHFGRDDFVAALCLLSAFFVVLPPLAWALLGRGRLEVLP
jgi:iron(III) transport system permease protein